MSKKNNSANKTSGGSVLLYGRHPVLAAVNNPKRKIIKIFCTKENVEELKKSLQQTQRNIPLEIIERKELDRMLPRDAVHQGFALQCKELENCSLEEICHLAEAEKNCHILLLDQVTDPQNIGAIIRSCVAFDTLALILQDKNSPTESGSMAKASAGMIEQLPICRVTNLSRAIEKLKDSGFWIIGMDGYATTYIDSVNKTGKIAIIMGSEGKGMRRLIEENCDTTVKLPIAPSVESLNVSTAAAIALYEINKK